MDKPVKSEDSKPSIADKPKKKYKKVEKKEEKM